jgi:hypothetical protein
VTSRLLMVLAAALPFYANATPALAQKSPPADKARSPLSEAQQRPPMVFYVAEGEDNACGEGCSEWIAAEGYIDLGSAERLRVFLDRHVGRNLPLFIASPGGILSDALAIGRLMRERGMTAGVATTVPVGCMPAEKEETCRALKRSGSEVAAELRTISASCNSSCVYTLLGAKVRQVGPDAHLGIHAGRLVRVSAADGRVRARSQARSPASQNAKTAEFEAEIRDYVREMGVDTGLVDAALKVPFEQVRYLSRDEIAGFGIDTRGFLETRWTAADFPKSPPAVFKFVTETRGSDGKEIRTSLIRLACQGTSQIAVAYVRGLASSEFGRMASIKVTMGDRDVNFPTSGSISKMDTLDTGAIFDTRLASAPIEFFESAAAGESFDITQSDPAGGSQPARVSKLSTAGLRSALDALRQRCGSVR